MDYIGETIPDLELNLSFYGYDFNETDVTKEKSLTFIPYLFVSAFGLVANALVLFVILRFRKMWTPTNLYVFSLALGDILHMLCLLFFASEIASGYWPLGKPMCILFWILTALIPFSNVYFLTIMSIDVFIQQYFPQVSKKSLRLQVVLTTSGTVWVVCLLLGIPLYVFADHTETSSCQILWPYPSAFWNLTFISYRLVLDFLFPVLVTCMFLILSGVRLRNQDKATESSSGNIKESIIMISGLMLVYFVFWLPTHVLEMISATVGDLELSEGSYYIISIIPYLKSCVYPVLYGFLSKSIKETLSAVLCCKKAQDSSSHPNGPSEKQEEKLSSC
ncbi:PREDICTED: somatostatin receptor type 5-like [Nanorana parkeri]|uniref:somatostatin receptor type 5-like n=1 Tax=Nanorana parkeri TaxID=125878 RepID=UPI000854E79A|nr:PREDICTED: somatostatin receptor type 5-like [Nanorana parkeri]